MKAAKHDQFPFPSNGKVYLKSGHPDDLLQTIEVEFPFPSNGKVYLKGLVYDIPVRVIKFPFPSNGKVYLKGKHRVLMMQMLSFHSLQTGKCISRNTSSSAPESGIRSFHSLQTGKCISRQYLQYSQQLSRFWFPFPSNGKVYLKKKYLRHCRVENATCFNSLQTGKRITSPPHCLSREKLRPRCFHSLQTGKRITSLSHRTVMMSFTGFHSLQTGTRITRASAYAA